MRTTTIIIDDVLYEKAVGMADPDVTRTETFLGTGTAGKYLNLAEGWRRTVGLLAPRRFWLLPSLAEDSRAVADLLAKSCGNFVCWTSGVRYGGVGDRHGRSKRL